MLASEGVLRGLIGPREVARLWERHLLNSSAVVPSLPDTGTIVDLGSGAGLPGVVVAAMRPGAHVVLLEPMSRRTEWLSEVVNKLPLPNARVVRGRAEDVVGSLSADVVTSRAVAAMDKLYRWSVPLLRVGGELVVLKGARANEEIEAARRVERKLGVGQVAVREAATLDGLDATRVVRAVRER
ncbi:16S rRNA (guanine(527)-N(7))-methyltransferase RsmG [Cellulomonas sp. HZM]|uniref:16S rRNA (guanine(527)-N(7))-methyltransferase RsmG n=1 Tax=Cellulomonas sp. HZM TaxID=1454010 RepID=UPI001E5FFC33